MKLKTSKKLRNIIRNPESEMILIGQVMKVINVCQGIILEDYDGDWDKVYDFESAVRESLENFVYDNCDLKTSLVVRLGNSDIYPNKEFLESILNTVESLVEGLYTHHSSLMMIDLPGMEEIDENEDTEEFEFRTAKVTLESANVMLEDENFVQYFSDVFQEHKNEINIYMTSSSATLALIQSKFIPSMLHYTKNVKCISQFLLNSEKDGLVDDAIGLNNYICYLIGKCIFQFKTSCIDKNLEENSEDLEVLNMNKSLINILNDEDSKENFICQVMGVLGAFQPDLLKALNDDWGSLDKLKSAIEDTLENLSCDNTDFKSNLVMKLGYSGIQIKQDILDFVLNIIEQTIEDVSAGYNPCSIPDLLDMMKMACEDENKETNTLINIINSLLSDNDSFIQYFDNVLRQHRDELKDYIGSAMITEAIINNIIVFLSMYRNIERLSDFISDLEKLVEDVDGLNSYVTDLLCKSTIQYTEEGDF